MPPLSSGNLAVISRTYDLVCWSCKHITKFPRGLRCTLGDRLELRLYDVLDRLIRARYTKDRAPLLRETNLDLELLRFQYRMAMDLKCLNPHSYEYALRVVNEIGQMVGGWLKGSPRNPDPEAT